MENKFQIIRSPALDGALNMALDEVLWREAERGAAYLRVYSWAPRPTLSLGHFQSRDVIAERPDWRRLPVVRRLTGGGTVVHDDELTFAIALPADLAPSTKGLYECVHRAIRQSLSACGIASTSGGAAAVGAETLCFRRHDRFAVHVGGHKVLGSAQRRSRQSVLLHGSLLLSRSWAAPELPGINDLISTPIDHEAIREQIVRAIPLELSIVGESIELPPSVIERAHERAKVSYAVL